MGRRIFVGLLTTTISGLFAVLFLSAIFFYSQATALFSVITGSVTFIFLLVVVLISLIILAGSILTKNLAGSINKIDFDTPDNIFDELDEFFQKIMTRDRQIESQISDLRAHSETIDALIKNMHDGFVMVDPTGKVVTSNPRAITLFGARQDPEGKNVINLLADSVFLRKIDAAIDGIGGQMTLQKNDRLVQLSFLPSASQGAIVLTADITERTQAENMRREFSANVSHELKTPLTIISGYAELMATGMAAPSDMALFANKVNNEAKRMINLIENILFLSNLDEQDTHKAFAPENITEIATEVIESLSQMAVDRDVEVSISALPQIIRCNKLLVYEMLMNLISNALQYNTAGGKVEVTIKVKSESKKGNLCYITIADTGIGIPAEEQLHVFERFYRVEQSRGRKTGGAGLGLSIVKHVVRYHNGSITLESEPGKGTRFEVVLPAT